MCRNTSVKPSATSTMWRNGRGWASALAGATAGLLIAALCGCDTRSSRPEPPPIPAKPTADSPRPTNQTPTPPQPPAPAKPVVAGPGPRWVCDQPEINFGEVWEGETILRNYQFRNAGTETLKIPKIKPHCSCSAADNYTKEVPPGGTGVIPFQMNTANKPDGPVREYLDLTTNDPTNPTPRIFLTGRINAVCNVVVTYDSLYERDRAAGKNPNSVEKMKGSFGTIKADDQFQRIIKLQNPRPNQPLQLTLQSPTDLGRFHIGFRETIPGMEYELTVEGRPPFPVNQTSVPITFRTNLQERPQFVLFLYAFVAPRIQVIPEKIVYDPERFAGQERPIRIINNGNTPLEVTEISCSEPRYVLALQPRDPAKPQDETIKVFLPGDGYVVPPYGELITIKTTDPEKAVINITVLPDLRAPATPRPPDRPLQMHPVPIHR